MAIDPLSWTKQAARLSGLPGNQTSKHSSPLSMDVFISKGRLSRAGSFPI